MKKTLIPANILLYMGLIALAFGITSVSIPEYTLKAMVIIIGSLIGIGGIIALIIRLNHKSDNKFIQVLSYIGSSIIILFGATLAVFPSTFLNIFIIIVGIAIILGGISQLILSLSFNPLSTAAKIFIGFSILLIIAGTVIILNPFKAIESLTIFFGVIIAAFGVLNVIISFWYRFEITQREKDKKNNTIEISVSGSNVNEAPKTETPPETEKNK
ncbi:MAG TPA: DUF308 domain-containing protein [Bacteroidales bacterium]|nr:DUF308 domain-containing protein [Bacteroidales bacterium]